MKGEKDCLFSSVRTAQNEVSIVKKENDRLTSANAYLVYYSQMLVEEKRDVMGDEEGSNGKLHDSHNSIDVLSFKNNEDEIDCERKATCEDKERKGRLEWLLYHVNVVDGERRRALKFSHEDYLVECETTMNYLFWHLQMVHEMDVLNYEDIDKEVGEILECQFKKSEEFRRPCMKQPERHEELFFQHDHDLTLEFILGPD